MLVQKISFLNPTAAAPLYNFEGSMPLPNSPTLPSLQYGTISNPDYRQDLQTNVFPNSSFCLQGNYQKLLVKGEADNDDLFNVHIEGHAFAIDEEDLTGFTVHTSEIIQDIVPRGVSSQLYWTSVTSISLFNPLPNLNVTSLECSLFPIQQGSPDVFLGPIFPDSNIIQSALQNNFVSMGLGDDWSEQHSLVGFENGPKSLITPGTNVFLQSMGGTLLMSGAGNLIMAINFSWEGAGEGVAPLPEDCLIQWSISQAGSGY